MPEKDEKKKKSSQSKRTKTLKVSNQIPRKRRREIERALDAHEPARVRELYEGHIDRERNNTRL